VIAYEWQPGLAVDIPDLRIRMKKETTLWTLIYQLNAEYKLSDEFKSKILDLINRLEGFELHPDQIEVLAEKVKDTYERQVLVESCRNESRNALQKIQTSINAYSTALNDINERLTQAETSLKNLLNSKPGGTLSNGEKGIAPFDKEKAKALVAFASIDSKNSKVN
jgi:septation ring formation regulator EzrA